MLLEGVYSQDSLVRVEYITINVTIFATAIPGLWIPHLYRFSYKDTIGHQSPASVPKIARKSWDFQKWWNPKPD